ncbi:MAG: glycosyltransferase family 4 protein [Salinivirgaceae bacterium]|nr:glycosyltransferase family 4 protein [Salinivirgaceae bacterium]
MNILINAYAVRPNSGSEGGAAWQWITGLARYHELYVITEGEWEDEIEKNLKGLANGFKIHFYYNPVSTKIRRMCWNQGDYRFYFYYAKWQKKTLKIAQTIVQEHHIDLIHQLNMIGFREPGYLWKIKNIPYVWGPIGGMNMVPMQYLRNASKIIRIKYYLKNLINKLQYHFQPRVLKAIKRANVLIAANKASFKVLSKLHPNKNVILINETGSNDEGMVQKKVNNGEEFNILWVGRFIPTKLLKLSLDVVGKLRELRGLTFHIVGQAFDEKETEKYHQIAHKMGLDGICQWHGWVTHEDVQDLMRQSDIFFFPSVVEGTPHVVLEAIANGLPVVCFNECGQAEAVNESVGIKIPLSTPDDSIKQFVSVIRNLYEDRDLLSKLSAGCEKRKKELSWERKVQDMIGIYERVK